MRPLRPLLGLGLAFASAGAFGQAQPPVYVTPVGGATARPPTGPNATPVVVSPPAGAPVAQPVGGGAVVVNPPVNGQSGPAMPLGGGLGDPPLPGGHYRLVATGFRVRHQTVDDMFETDGPGDEVVVRADVLTYRNNGEYVSTRTVTSGVFGRDGDIRAGNGHQWNSADDQPGGMITSDVYPPRRARFDTTPSRVPRDLPIVVWEGDLTAGDAVLVIPSIWEWDSPDDSRAQQAWDAALRAQGSQLRIGGTRTDGTGTRHRPWETVMPRVFTQFLSVPDEGTRPIGASRRGELRSGPPLNPTGIVLTPLLNDQYVTTVHWAANDPAPGPTPPDGPWQLADLRLAPGEIYLTFDDEPALEGKYGLDLKLEKMR